MINKGAIALHEQRTKDAQKLFKDLPIGAVFTLKNDNQPYRKASENRAVMVSTLSGIGYRSFQMDLNWTVITKDSIKDGFGSKQSIESELRQAEQRRKSLLGSRDPIDIREAKELTEYIQQLEKELKNWKGK